MTADLKSLGSALRELLGPSLPTWVRVSTSHEALTFALRGDLKVRFHPQSEGMLGTWLTTFPLEDLEVEDDDKAPVLRATIEAAIAQLEMDAVVELHQRRLDFGWVPVVTVCSQPTTFFVEGLQAMGAFILGAERWREAVLGTLTHEAKARWVV